MRDRAIIADARTTSAAEFLRELRGDPNDISRCEQAGGYFLREGEWRIIRECHYGVRKPVPYTRFSFDRDPETGNDRVAA
jgi:hypothetical protein